MTKQELFNINTGVNSKYTDRRYITILINYFYNNYFDEIFSVYTENTIVLLIATLLNFVKNPYTEIYDNDKDRVFKLIQNEIEYKIDNLLKNRLSNITKILDFYELAIKHKYDIYFFNKKKNLKILFNNILVKCLEDNVHFKAYLNDANLNFEIFMEDLLITENYINYDNLLKHCLYNKFNSLREFLDFQKEIRKND